MAHAPGRRARRWSLPLALAAACSAREPPPAGGAHTSQEPDRAAAAGVGSAGEPVDTGAGGQTAAGAPSGGGSGANPSALGGATGGAADAGAPGDGGCGAAGAGESGAPSVEPHPDTEETIVTFEDALAGAPLPPDYAGLGWSGPWQVTRAVSGRYGPSSGVVLVASDAADSSTTITFPRPVHFLGASFSHGSGATVQLEAFDENGVALDKSTILTQALTPRFLSFHANYVHSLRVSWIGAGCAMDDVTYLEYE